MKPIICTDVQRYKNLPYYTVTIYDIDSPVNFHSYDCLFYKQGFDLEKLSEEAEEKIKEYNKP